MQKIDLKETLAVKAGEPEATQPVPKKEKDTDKMIDVINAMMPDIMVALPKFITPKHFIMLAVSVMNSTPGISQCTPVSFVAALMNAVQLGLEPNTPLGQAYLIPYRNNKKGVVECQFQVGYKGLISLAYSTGEVQTIQAHAVYENDYFEYEYGLNAKLIHRPAFSSRGKQVCFYGFFCTVNGGYGMAVMGKEEMDMHARMYSAGLQSQYSLWRTNYSDMAKKTVIKKALKYAPLKTEFQKILSSDESIKLNLSENMLDVENQIVENDAA